MLTNVQVTFSPFLSTIVIPFDTCVTDDWVFPAHTMGLPSDHVTTGVSVIVALVPEAMFVHVWLPPFIRDTEVGVTAVALKLKL